MYRFDVKLSHCILSSHFLTGIGENKRETKGSHGSNCSLLSTAQTKLLPSPPPFRSIKAKLTKLFSFFKENSQSGKDSDIWKPVTECECANCSLQPLRITKILFALNSCLQLGYLASIYWNIIIKAQMC